MEDCAKTDLLLLCSQHVVLFYHILLELDAFTPYKDLVQQLMVHSAELTATGVERAKQNRNLDPSALSPLQGTSAPSATHSKDSGPLVPLTAQTIGTHRFVVARQRERSFLPGTYLRQCLCYRYSSPLIRAVKKISSLLQRGKLRHKTQHMQPFSSSQETMMSLIRQDVQRLSQQSLVSLNFPSEGAARFR